MEQFLRVGVAYPECPTGLGSFMGLFNSFDRVKKLVAIFGGISLSVIAAPGAVQAADYVDSIVIKTSSIRCGYFVDTQACYGFVPFSSSRPGVTGDTFSVHVALEDRLYVPGSETSNLFNVQAVDGTAVLGGGAPGPFVGAGQMTMLGYLGPALPLADTYILNSNFGYGAAGGFCCGYGAPNAGFSLTGADVSIEVLTDETRPLVGYVAGYTVALPATPDVLANFQGGSPDSPVILPEGLVGQINGNISGPYSAQSFYGFTWQGGVFQTNAQVFGADPAASFSFKLYDSSLNLLENLLLDGSNDFSRLMTVNSLDAGLYTIGLQTFSSLDPSFTISFFTPVGEVSAVPEPSVWAMLIAGFGLAGAMLRGRRALALA